MKNLSLLFCSLLNSALSFGQLVPSITSFSPANGPVGTSVTITGTNFSATPAENTVYFGATKATVSSSTISQLHVLVPSGATDQPITVTVNGLTANSSSPFKVTFPFGGYIAPSFASRIDFWAGAQTKWSAACDIDGDGKTDIVAVDQSSNVVSVFRNTSTPGSIGWDSFQGKVDFATGPGPYAVTTGDLDGDGKPDLVVTNINGNSVSVLRNTSAPGYVSFSPTVELETFPSSSFAAIRDLDLDGKPEIVVASSNDYSIGYVSIFGNTSVVGALDLSSFAPRVDLVAAHGGIWGVALNDVDDDGKADIAVTSGGDGLVSIFKNISTPGAITTGSFEPKVDFSTGGGYPSIVSLADLDGDHKNDLIVGNTGDGMGGYTFSIFRNIAAPGVISAGSFDTQIHLGGADSPWNPAVGDVDGDGKLDVLVRGSNGMLAILKNISSPGALSPASFSTPYMIETGGASLGISVADMDGDGKSDLMISNEGTNVVSVFRNMDISPPTVLPATFVSNTGFEAGWNSVTNVSEYHLDVSASNAFDSFVNGYQDKVIYSSNQGEIRSTVAGLLPGKKYFYRVRAAGIAENSSIILVTTAPNPTTLSPNVWAKQFGGPGDEEIQTLTSDDKGNVYAAGHFTGTITLGSRTLTSKGDLDIFFARFDEKGRVVWARSIGGSTYDNEVSLATDCKGLYMTAQFAGDIDVDPGNGITQFNNEGQLSVNDGFFARYNMDNGSLEWAQHLIDATTWSSSSIGVDQTGVYLAGHYSGAVDFDPGRRLVLRTAQGSDDIFLAKYSLNGKFSWVSSMGGYDWDSGYGLLVDGTGVYINGSYGLGSDFDPSSNYVTLDGNGGFFGRYDLATGNLVYVKNVGNGLIWTLDKYGKDLYIAGEFDGSIDADPDHGAQMIGTDGFHSGLIGKYNKLDGSFRWAKNIITTGWIGPRKLNADGTGVYLNGYFGGSVDFDSGPAMVNRTASPNGNAFAAYYESSGKLDWVKGLGNAGHAISIASTLTEDGYYMGGLFADTVNFDPYNGNVKLTAIGGDDIFLARYRPTKKVRRDLDSFRENSTIASREDQSTSTLFPNPAADVLQIDWHGFNGDELIEVRVLDVMGNQVITRTMSVEEISIDVSKLSKGYHIFRARQNDTVQTLRFIKL